MKLLYDISISLYSAGVRLAALTGNKKAKDWIDGRKNSFQTSHQGAIWFHCASLGEYEQITPLFEPLKKIYDKPVIVSFFSPSGFQYFQKHQNPLVDDFFYLPLDTEANANRLIYHLKPTVFFLVKYELWHRLISKLHDEKVPCYFLSARIKNSTIKNDLFFGFNSLNKFRQVFTNDHTSQQRLLNQNINNILIGDTRYDKALINQKESFDYSFNFKKDLPILILGSCWSDDLEIFEKELNWILNHFNLVIAPHEINPAKINEINNTLSSFKVKIEKYSQSEKSSYDVLIIDSIGQLKYLYRYAHVAYIGGGFKTGLHNIIEALIYKIPVIIGPKHHQFPEAIDAIESNAAFPIANSNELKLTLERLLNSDYSESIEIFVASQLGASQKLIDYIKKEVTNQ